MMLTGKTTSVIILIPPSIPILMFYLLTSVEGIIERECKMKSVEEEEDKKGILSMELPLANVISERGEKKKERK